MKQQQKDLSHLRKSELSSLPEATGHSPNRSQLDAQILGHLCDIPSLVKWALGSGPETNKELADHEHPYKEQNWSM